MKAHLPIIYFETTSVYIIVVDQWVVMDPGAATVNRLHPLAKRSSKIAFIGWFCPTSLGFCFHCFIVSDRSRSSQNIRTSKTNNKTNPCVIGRNYRLLFGDVALWKSIQCNSTPSSSCSPPTVPSSSVFNCSPQLKFSSTLACLLLSYYSWLKSAIT